MRLLTKSTLPLAIAVACLTAAGSDAAVLILGADYTLGTGVTVTSVDGFKSTTGATALTAYSGDVSGSDLLHGLTPTADGNWFTSSGRGPANLVDGAHGTASDVGSLAQTENPPATVVFNLGTGANGTGFDLSSLTSIASWNNAGFGNQVWTLEVAGVGDDGSLTSTDFSTLVTAVYTPLGSNDSGATKVTATGLSGTLTSGVQYVRITGESNPLGLSNRFAWREFDIDGTSTAAIPEPSTTALLLLGGLAMILRRRR